MDVSTLVQFSKLVSDSSNSEGVFSLLAETIVEQCGAFHAVVFGTDANGDFNLLTSYGACEEEKVRSLDLEGVASVAELRSAVMKACPRGYDFRALPLISETGLFGALVVLYSESHPFNEVQWTFVEGLTELTAISISKAYQHQKLQKAFDDLRISQDALVRSEKFRALGQMAAGIAHDLKNLLNPLLLYTDLIREAARESDEVLDIAARVERILTRGVETVERLRDFSRQSSEDVEAVPTNVNDMVHEAVEITKPRLNRINLVVRLGEPPATLIRPADCVTAIVNLLLNAADALEGNGVITVSTGSSDQCAWIEVADNGPGMSPDVKSKVLEPFFTTKGEGGTGLGLPIVYAFTERYGGRLEIESEIAQGAKFKIFLPAVQAPSA